jgi:iron complex outermembrane receptor protein
VIKYFGLFDSPVTDSVHNNHNWSVYGEVSYDLADKLSLRVSGRYVHLEDKAVFDSPDNSRAKLVSKKFLPGATLSYKINGGVIYARYAKGFKEGGINPVVPPSTFVDPITHQVSPGFVFGPETVDTYEIGAKGRIGHNLSYTTAIFYNRYTNLEFDTTGDAKHQGIIEAIVNAKEAKTYGAEASIDWRPIPVLTLGINAGYLHAKYTNFKFDGTNIGLNSVDYTGQRMLYAPKLQLGITGNLDQPISDNYRLVSTVLVSHISSTIQSNNPDEPPVIQPGYWLANLRVGVRTTDDHVGVFLFVNNLFDKYYTTFGSSGGTGASQVEGDPRIIGGEVQIKF